MNIASDEVKYFGKKTIRFSIAMATYNGAKYLDQQLESFAKQTLLPYELVVTDDGSTDDTVAIIERFAKRAPFLVRINRNKTRLHYADNFLYAASLCEGDWIAFSDQDDVWLKEKLECVSRFAKGGVTMVVHRIKAVDEALRPIARSVTSCSVRRGKNSHRVQPMGYFNGMCITFNAALLGLLIQRPRFPSIYDQRQEAAHDFWVSSIADSVGGVKYIDRVLVLYRQHGENTCGASSEDFKGISLNRSLSTTDTTYRSGAELALQYSERFQQLALSSAGLHWKASLEATSLRYWSTHDYLLARAELYSAARFPTKLRAMVGMTVRWSYRFNPVRPPVFAFMKDFFTVLFWAVNRRKHTDQAST